MVDCTTRFLSLIVFILFFFLLSAMYYFVLVFACKYYVCMYVCDITSLSWYTYTYTLLICTFSPTFPFICLLLSFLPSFLLSLFLFIFYVHSPILYLLGFHFDGRLICLYRLLYYIPIYIHPMQSIESPMKPIVSQYQYR